MSCTALFCVYSSKPKLLRQSFTRKAQEGVIALLESQTGSDSQQC